MSEVPDVKIKEINPETRGKTCRITGRIVNVSKPKIVDHKNKWCCRHCQNKVYEYPALDQYDYCPICGKERKFKHIDGIHGFYKIQNISVADSSTTRKLQVRLTEDHADDDKYKVGQQVQIVGKVTLKKIKLEVQYIFICDEINILEDYPDDDIDEVAARESPEYRKWVNTCKQRDNNKCQICGGHKHLEVHHIYNYKDHPELRLDEGNGITLCTFCHQKFHSYYGKKCTPSDLVRFIFELG